MPRNRYQILRGIHLRPQPREEVHADERGRLCYGSCATCLHGINIKTGEHCGTVSKYEKFEDYLTRVQKMQEENDDMVRTR